MVDIFLKDRNFMLNARRGSLQLRSACNRGEVIANLPLSEFLFRELRVVAEEDQVILEE